MPRAFQIQPEDNVATLLDPGEGVLEVIGETRGEVLALEPIQASHKVALEVIQAGEPVIKYGVPIGSATRDIRAGEWVHLHNCASRFDERSQTLDVNSGATTDTAYE